MTKSILSDGPSARAVTPSSPQPNYTTAALPEPRFVPPPSFRNSIPSPQFPVEADRYVLYVNSCCPWAHRTILARALKHLENIIPMVEVDARDRQRGWWFSGSRGPERDPLYGFKYLRELYQKADPGYQGRITVPFLWDKKTETIVNNESSDILRIFISSFDPLLPPADRETTKGPKSLIPAHLSSEINTFNTWIYTTINNGVYKAGLATTQASYEAHIATLFAALDRLEMHLAKSSTMYLFGDHITEPDIRLFTTLIRFDVVYYTLFKCNLKMIRSDYPSLHAWLRRVYWNEGSETAGGAFKNTTFFAEIKQGYSSSIAAGNGIVPAGPVPFIMPL